MAIDTLNKRQSAFSAFQRISLPSVTPDNSKPLAWRQQALWGYSGIAPDGATTFQVAWAVAVNKLIGGF